MAYIGRVNDPLLQQDPVTASTLNGATIEARNMGQEPVWTSQMESQQPLDPNLAKGMAYLYNDVIGKLAQANQQQPTVQPEQQAPILVQGLMPALVDGAEYQARPTVDEVQAQPQQRVPLNQMAKMYADQIVQAKGLYGEAEQAGNAEAMAYAHNAAEQARAGLQQLGVDPEAYGLNGTYQEAQQAMASNNLQAMNNVLNGEFSESSGMYYDRIYKILRDQGFSRDIAEREAHNRAENYSSRRMQALGQTFEMYGHDPTTINPMGVQLLGMMAQEDMDMANYYTQRYAGPLQEYADAKQQRNMATQQANKERTMAIGQKYDLQKMEVAEQYRERLATINAKIAAAQAANDFQLKRALEVEKAKIKAQYGLTKNKGKSGSSSGSGDDGGLKPTEALSVIEKYNKWNSDHEGEEWQNPLTDAYDEALATLNRQSPAPHDVNNADSVYSWAQSVLEYNARNGYPATPEALYQAIAAVGGYGPAVAEELKNDPNKPLEKYGRTN